MPGLFSPARLDRLRRHARSAVRRALILREIDDHLNTLHTLPPTPSQRAAIRRAEAERAEIARRGRSDT